MRASLILGSMTVFALPICLVLAQDEPTLHEYVPNVASLDGVSFLSMRGGEVEALVYGGEVIRAPEAGELGAREPVVAAVGPASGEGSTQAPSTIFEADRQTSLESDVDYDLVFAPRISPFKRVVVYDRVALGDDGRTPVLTLSEPIVRPVPITGLDRPARGAIPRERFWGRVVADFSEGVRVRLPSVAPDSRILQWRVEPQVPIRIERDTADAYYAVTDRPHDEPVRLVWLTDAPADYFSRPLPDQPIGALRSRVPELPARVRRRALSLLGELGIPRRGGVAGALSALAGHFRSFVESEEPPRNTGDLLSDLTRGRRGICRHRAYAFTILAQALGIPTRLVHNEAHAWVEVELAPDDWLRVDLGGSATGLRTHAASTSPRYAPIFPDPFPRPEEYRRNMATLEPGAGVPQGDPASWSHGAAPGPTANGASPPAAGDAVPEPTDGRRALSVRLFTRSYRVFRGRQLEVSGRVSDAEGEGISGMRIEARLVGAREVALGVTVSRVTGGFNAAFGVPPNLPVGDYRLVVQAMGDAEWAPAVAP